MQAYIKLVPDDGNLLIHLEDIFSEMRRSSSPLSEEKMNYSYAPGKWTIKDMLVHMSDTERIFVYRALTIFHGGMKRHCQDLRKVYLQQMPGQMKGRKKIFSGNIPWLGNPALLSWNLFLMRRWTGKD